MSKRRIRAAALAVASPALGFVARTDLCTAAQADEKQDFPKAFQENRLATDAADRVPG